MRRFRGTSLIELVIAIALIAIALPSMTSLMGTNINRSINRRQYESAASYANTILERTRSMAYSSLAPLDGDSEQVGIYQVVTEVDGVRVNRPDSISGSVSTARLIRIQVRVTWDTGEVVLATLRSEPDL